MKKIIFILFVIVFSANRFAERKINGIVTDATNGNPIPGVNVVVKGTTRGTVTNINGYYQISLLPEDRFLVFTSIGFVKEEIAIKEQPKINVIMHPDSKALQEVVVAGDSAPVRESVVGSVTSTTKRRDREEKKFEYTPQAYGVIQQDVNIQQFNTEGYSTIHENEFHEATKNPLSTFSIDVDAASYSNVRRFINNGQRPPIDAVRIEEMINYFNYNYPQPDGEVPFAVYTELAQCPWNTQHKLLHIGLQGRIVPTENLPASNIVFLIDVSGSMQPANKLPLLKSAFKMLVQQLRPRDRVAIVVYAGAAGLVLPSTPGNEKETISDALDRLSAGGSTAGGAGLQLAYQVAEQNFVKSGNNRIILATDGDFNIGASSNAEMERLIEKEREKGVFMTVLGFGMGNYKDDKMEIIADKGNGNYAYIDNLQEAKKVLVNEFGGTLFTIAKDVKIQIEFNPANVQAYRLIGYENRKLNDEDFNDDKKDAGELGSGHTVTALYEIIPVGVENSYVKKIDDLKYQQNQVVPKAHDTDELLTLKLRYKQPDGDKSQLITSVVKTKDEIKGETSDNFRWSAAVAAYGMILRDSEFKGNATLDKVIEMAKNARGKDPEGYRSEFIRMVQSTDFLAKR